MNMDRTIEYIYSREEIKTFLKEQKRIEGNILQYLSLSKKLKPKKNRPKFSTATIELDQGYKVVFQNNNSDEFPEYSAILIKHSIRLCRLDYHDAHRRRCKKEIFCEAIANELHLHLYCEDCLKENLKYDSFVLNILDNKLKTFNFECFMALFCEIIHLDNDIPCSKGLF
jgi:hypothetical protein